VQVDLEKDICICNEKYKFLTPDKQCVENCDSSLYFENDITSGKCICQKRMLGICVPTSHTQTTHRRKQNPKHLKKARKPEIHSLY
jgi:hypothetical protein